MKDEAVMKNIADDYNRYLNYQKKEALETVKAYSDEFEEASRKPIKESDFDHLKNMHF